MELNSKFETSAFPNQFHQPKSKSGIELGVTQAKSYKDKTL